MSHKYKKDDYLKRETEIKFYNQLLERNNYDISPDILELLKKLIPNSKNFMSFPYLTESHNVKLWLQISELLFKKFISVKNTKDEYIFEKKINNSFSLNIHIDKSRYKDKIKMGEIYFPFYKFYLIDNITKNKVRFNFALWHRIFQEDILHQNPEIVYKKYYLSIKAYFFYIDEFIDVIKPYFDDLSKKSNYEI